jgi:hypothetical protein
VTWLVALLYWNYAHVEEKWEARMGRGDLETVTPSRSVTPEALSAGG